MSAASELETRRIFELHVKELTDSTLLEEYRRFEKGSVQYDVFLGELIRRGLDDDPPEDS